MFYAQPSWLRSGEVRLILWIALNYRLEIALMVERRLRQSVEVWGAVRLVVYRLTRNSSASDEHL